MLSIRQNRNPIPIGRAQERRIHNRMKPNDTSLANLALGSISLRQLYGHTHLSISDLLSQACAQLGSSADLSGAWVSAELDDGSWKLITPANINQLLTWLDTLGCNATVHPGVHPTLTYQLPHSDHIQLLPFPNQGGHLIRLRFSSETSNNHYSLELVTTNYVTSVQQLTPWLDQLGDGLSLLIALTEQHQYQKHDNEQVRKLSRAVEQMHASVVITNTKGEIEFVNPAFCKLTGYTPEEAIGQNPRILKTDYTSSAAYQDLWQTLLAGQEWTGEFCNRKKNGETYWESANISPIFNDQHQITHFIAVKENITARKATERALLEAKEQAEAASKAKSEFLANMSHEIRTPLNGVIGFTDLLINTQLSDTQAEYLKIVHHSAHSLLDIINSILDFSKIEAGKLDIQVEKTDIVQMLSEITDMVSFQVEKKHLELLLNTPPNLPRYIWTDPIRLRQVLVNLLGNAVKFTQQGEIKLQVDQVDISNSEMRLRFSVSDSGIGIQPENLSKIFDAFEQADASTTRQFGGTGLGLSIANRLLGLMHESKLQVTSEVGKGSCFFFEASVKFEEGAAVNDQALDHFKQVLLVDDNASNRFILQEILSFKGVPTLLAESGEQAIRTLQNNPSIDLVLMDYQMPFQDGIETIRIIREELHLAADRLPILLLSSAADSEFLTRACEKYQVAQKLTKPIRMNSLLQALTIVKQPAEINVRANSLPHNSLKLANNEPNQNCQILIVDDNEVNLLLARTIIQQVVPHAQIRQAINGQEAVEACGNLLPDIIFMDIQMPVMNGYEAATTIRQRYSTSSMPIVALTAGTLSGERERVLEAGMNDYISKPFSQEDITRLLTMYGIASHDEVMAE